jgi:hypothetical protein
VSNRRFASQNISKQLCFAILVVIFTLFTGCISAPDQVIHIRITTRNQVAEKEPPGQTAFNIIIDGKTVAENETVNKDAPFVTKVSLKSGLHRLKIVETKTGAVVQAAIDSSPEQWFSAIFLLLEDGTGTMEYDIQKKPWTDKDQEKPKEPEKKDKPLKETEDENKDKIIDEKFDELKKEASSVDTWNKKSRETRKK